ncbi:hypothetical protein QUB63_06920 [Microcoleus sp. ARI1-B5]
MAALTVTKAPGFCMALELRASPYGIATLQDFLQQKEVRQRSTRAIA